MDWNATRMNRAGVKLQIELLSKQTYGQCGWLKKEDAYRTVCKTRIYPKSKVCSQKICPVNHGLVCSGKQGGVLVRSVPGNSSLVPSRKYLWAWYSGIEWNIVKALIEALRHLHLATVTSAP